MEGHIRMLELLIQETVFGSREEQLLSSMIERGHQMMEDNQRVSEAIVSRWASSLSKGT